jgi:competence protein ComEA
MAAASTPPTAQAAPGSTAPAAAALAPCPPAPSGAASPAPLAAPIVLNRAGLDDLMRLPGIGRKRAQAIVELRERLGRFVRPSDLLRVRGIGTKALARLLPLVVIDASPPHEALSGAASGAAN